MEGKIKATRRRERRGKLLLYSK